MGNSRRQPGSGTDIPAFRAARIIPRFQCRWKNPWSQKTPRQGGKALFSAPCSAAFGSSMGQHALVCAVRCLAEQGGGAITTSTRASAGRSDRPSVHVASRRWNHFLSSKPQAVLSFFCFSLRVSRCSSSRVRACVRPFRTNGLGGREGGTRGTHGQSIPRRRRYQRSTGTSEASSKRPGRTQRTLCLTLSPSLFFFSFPSLF